MGSNVNERACYSAHQKGTLSPPNRASGVEFLQSAENTVGQAILLRMSLYPKPAGSVQKYFRYASRSRKPGLGDAEISRAAPAKERSSQKPATPANLLFSASGWIGPEPLRPC